MDQSSCQPDHTCGMNKLQRIIGGKWKIMILWNLHDKTLRFGALSREMPFITQSMLTKQLRELEEDGFVHRNVYREVPPRVEYSLTDLGQRFIPLLVELNNWSEVHLSQSKREKNT